jgi:CHRD domain
MRRMLITLCALLSLTGLGVTAETATVSAQPLGGHYGARLTGGAQVPAVDTPARGWASVVVSQDGKTARFRVVAVRLSSAVVGAHIHLGHVGENGPIIVNLAGLPGVTQRSAGSGYYLSGSFTAANLAGPLAGHSLADLVADMNGRDTYVNVHTTMHREGEIRGELHRTFL